ncbi:redoxin family protein [Sphingomicrobium sp. XHP0239]|uniref:redoxin family protein n=1 Tax=Sphingomicrobium maritimum TaxID=3133972 RepID=UPI0031CC4F85
MVARLLPLAIALALLAFAGWRLASPSEGSQVTSQLVGEHLPELSLPPMVDGTTGIEPIGRDEPYLINLFGSWCVPCIAEAEYLDDLARQGVPIDGIAVRDEPEAVQRFLDRHGDPFARIGADPDSQAMLELGATGVPETFLIDADGVVRAHWQGPIEADDLPDILARVEALR